MAGSNKSESTMSSCVHYLYMFLLFAGTLLSLFLVMIFNREITDFEDSDSTIRTKGYFLYFFPLKFNRYLGELGKEYDN